MIDPSPNYGSGPLLETLEPRLLLSGSLVISEFMASNNTTLADGDNEYSDWIEIYNPTDTAVDMAGWKLADNENDATPWVFPTGGPLDITLDPGEYLLVFASGQDEADYPYNDGTYYHTDFKLSMNDDGQNEDVMLYDADGTLVHGYEDYVEQFTDVSYGIYLGGAWWETLLGENAPVSYLVPTAGDAGDTGAKHRKIQ